MFPLDSEWNREFQRRLLAWYRRHRRRLPWRENRDPYRVWLSEIMLQQTQVATVIAYFERFIAAFPTVAELAAADEQQVLRLWEGLGYYRRARQLHLAAQQIVEVHAGQFPQTPDQVRALPGIGRYTAGAICSIAFDAREPILEANTIRLFSRLIAYREDVSSTAGQKRLWEVAEQILPNRKAGDFNQALMELGAQLCTPREPDCPACPVAELCATNLAGLQGEIPLPKKKTKFEEVDEAAVVVRRGAKVLLMQCPAGSRWAGLWDFPRFPLQARRGSALTAELIAKVAELTGVTCQPSERITTLKHGVTRFRITLHCHGAEYVSAKRSSGRPPLQWLKPADLATVPLNTTGRRLSKLLLD